MIPITISRTRLLMYALAIVAAVAAALWVRSQAVRVGDIREARRTLEQYERDLEELQLTHKQERLALQERLETSRSRLDEIREQRERIAAELEELRGQRR